MCFLLGPETVAPRINLEVHIFVHDDGPDWPHPALRAAHAHGARTLWLSTSTVLYPTAHTHKHAHSARHI